MGTNRDVLETAVERRRALSALADGPLHRRELQAELDVSKTTAHRIVRTFDEQGLLRRTDDGYTLTALGDVVAQQADRFTTNLEVTYRLAPLVEAIETADLAFDPERFADATVTEPRPDDPSPPVNRYLELFRQSERIRTLDRTSFIPPLYIEEIFELSFEGDKAGLAIFPRSVVEQRLEEYPEIHRRAVEQDKGPIYRVCEDVPFGLTIYDTDHVALRAYDDDTGALLQLVDTADQPAVDWAEDVFETYRDRSVPAGAVEELPDWLPNPDS